MSQSQQNHFAELLIRDAAGTYRPATGDEVLKAARQIICRRVRRGSALTSPDVVAADRPMTLMPARAVACRSCRARTRDDRAGHISLTATPRVLGPTSTTG
jgi:hypothetical protein